LFRSVFDLGLFGFVPQNEGGKESHFLSEQVPTEEKYILFAFQEKNRGRSVQGKEEAKRDKRMTMKTKRDSPHGPWQREHFQVEVPDDRYRLPS
jgi:hypothetical protein